MPKCELTQLTPASPKIFRSSAPLYLPRPEALIRVTHRRAQFNRLKSGRSELLDGARKVLGNHFPDRPSLASDGHAQRISAQLQHPGGNKPRRSRITCRSLQKFSSRFCRHRFPFALTTTLDPLVEERPFPGPRQKLPLTWALAPAFALQFPPAAPFRPHPLLRDIRVHLQVRTIPREPLSQARRHISQQQRLCDHALELEISAGLHFAALAGVQPFPLVAGRAGQCLRRLLVTVHFRLRNQLRIAAIERTQNLSTISDEEHPLIFLFMLRLHWTIFFQLVGPCRFQSTVIPGELYRRHIASRPEAVADDRGQRISLIIAIARTRFHTERRIQLQHAKDRVETVGPHIAQRSATEVSPPAPHKRQIRMVKRPLRRWPQPHIPIQTFGRRLSFFGPLNALWPERTARPILDLAHRANRAIPNPFAELASRFRRLVAHRNLRGYAGFARNFSNAPRLINGVGQRLLAKNMFAFPHRSGRHSRMKIVGSTHDNGVDILLLLQQLAEVAISRASLILSRARLRAVISVNNFLARFAPRNSAGNGESVRQLNRLVGAEPIPPAVDAQQFPHGMAELMRTPLRIIRAGFIDVTDGHALHVSFFQEMQHHAQSLRTHANECNIYFVAGRNIACAAQNPARHNRKTDSRRGALPQELTPRNPTLQ